jgi:hypothetical protein
MGHFSWLRGYEKILSRFDNFSFIEFTWEVQLIIFETFADFIRIQEEVFYGKDRSVNV